MNCNACNKDANPEWKACEAGACSCGCHAMFPAAKGSWIEEEIHGIMAQLDGLIKGADEFYATAAGPPGYDRDVNNQSHGEYLGKLKTALVLVRDCLV